MALYGLLDENNIVINVIVVADQDTKNADGNIDEQIGIAFCRSIFGEDTKWVLGSDDGSVRKNAIAVNSVYDEILDAIIDKQPFSSWILNEETVKWEAPIPYPQDGNFYGWREEKLAWEKVIISTE